MMQDKSKPRDITLEDVIGKIKGQVSEVAHLEDHHFTETPIICKWCGSTDVMKYGSRKGVQEYICQKCGRKFIAKDAPYRKQTPTEQIGKALDSYYNGLSFADIARQLTVNESTVYRWVISYTNKALDILEPLKPKVSDTWVVDETVIKVEGGNMWFWDVIDENTRFLLASHLSRSRTINDVKTVMHRAQKRAGKSPRFIISDKLSAYIDGIEQIFGADAKHIQSWGMTEAINTNIIERFHGTIKERTKVLRGFKTLDTAELILDGFLLHYNFFRPHMSLKNQTPAQIAGIRIPYKTWTDLIREIGGIHLDA